MSGAPKRSSGIDRSELATKASVLRALHHEGRPLILPNAWDVASAQLVEATGFPVIATSSGAVAAALGFGDGDSMPVVEAFGAVARITRSVNLPVTADIEAGYRLEPEDLVEHLLEAGAVGCNLEDTDHHGPNELVDLDEQAERLAAVRSAAREAGIEIVINARVDVRLEPGDEEPRFGEMLGRARSYLDAGADCVYPIFLSDEGRIGEFVQQVQAPVNVMLIKESPPVARLAELGVARISLAGRLMRRAFAALRDSLTELKDMSDKLG